jgi:hypothetical protein
VTPQRTIGDSRVALFFAALLCLITPIAHAEDTAAAIDPTQWRVWMEPKFMHTPVVVPLAEAQRTELAAGALSPGGLTAFTKDDFAALLVDRELFHSVAILNTAYDLKKLRFRFERDKHRVIRYAAIESDEPVVASAVLFPGFLDLWKNTLGEKVLIVVPNRYTAYLFPRLATDYLDYAPMIFRAYRDTAYPVSVEVFEIGPDGWHCLGAYAEP